MSESSNGRPIVLSLLAVAAAVAIGFAAFNAGVAHGVAQNAKFVAPPAGAQYVYLWPRPWGYGFGFGFIFPVILVLFLIRGLFWRRRWYGGYGYGPHYGCGRPHEPQQQHAPETTKV